MMNWMTEKENILLKLENQKLNEDIRELNKELDKFRPFKSAYEMKKEIERLNNIVNECSNDILKELKENNHLSYGAALAIRQKLIDFKELKGDSSNE